MLRNCIAVTPRERNRFQIHLNQFDQLNNCRYLCRTKIQENTNIIVVVAYSMFLFLIKLNFRRQIVIFLSLHEENL